MTSTGKAARKRHGTRFAAKRAKARRPGARTFGKLPYSASRGNIQGWQTGALGLAEERAGVVDEDRGML